MALCEVNLTTETLHKQKPRLILIDGSGFVYRAYYALPRLTKRSGQPTGAVYGFLTMINKILKDYEFTSIAVAFDTAAPTFRHNMFKEYKKSRPPMPPELAQQWPYIREICNALGIPALEVEGFEADDIIASLAHIAALRGYEVLIVTSDKDMLQLVSDDIHVYHPLRDRDYDPKRVQEEFGFEPKFIQEYMALVGDKIDDVPGVKGVGDKTARELISKFKTLETIYENLDQIPPRFRTKLEADKNSAFLSRDLVRLQSDTSLEIAPEALRKARPRLGDLVKLLKELEFFSHLEQYVTDIHDTNAHYRLAQTFDEIQSFVKKSLEVGRCALYPLYEGDHPLRGILIALALAVEPGQAMILYAPAETRLSEPIVPIESWLPLLQELGVNHQVTKIFYDAKSSYGILSGYNLSPFEPFEDIMLMAYVLDPGRPSLELERLTVENLLYRPISPPDARNKARTWEDVPLPVLVDYTGERADAILQIADIFKESFSGEQGAPLRRVYEDLEKPLVGVLARMEHVGVKVNIPKLKNLAQQISRDVHTIQERIFKIVGFTFNLNSSQQLAKVLFEHLNLQPTKKTKKTRQHSTRQEVLEELAQAHEVPRLILDYRTRSKIKSTFVDALIHYADKESHRVHTRFNQAVAATGRLSSSEPNLQNIPIREELGDALRDSFITDEGWVLISADYSQIELRILAHLSGDPRLIEAFRQGQDIHARTAAEVLGKPSDKITPEDRRLAKAVNYGIAYGLSAYGLSQQTGMDVHEAQAYIDRYFQRYTAVRTWLDQTLSQARAQGYVESLFGRRRYIPDLNSSDHQVRQAAERQAVNMPMQATAADIMKFAMITIDQWLREGNRKARIVLQVHDELLLETPMAELATTLEGVKQRMENVVSLTVPLKVDIHAGPTWYQAKEV